MSFGPQKMAEGPRRPQVHRQGSLRADDFWWKFFLHHRWVPGYLYGLPASHLPPADWEDFGRFWHNWLQAQPGHICRVDFIWLCDPSAGSIGSSLQVCMRNHHTFVILMINVIIPSLTRAPALGNWKWCLAIKSTFFGPKALGREL